MDWAFHREDVGSESAFRVGVIHMYPTAEWGRVATPQRQ